jgi:hypothetical protein
MNKIVDTRIIHKEKVHHNLEMTIQSFKIVWCSHSTVITCGSPLSCARNLDC